MQLNAAQKAAVEYLEGPLLVLAGPGTGKTQLLSSRVAHILQHTDTAPENILCLTFTENGAENMRERLLSLIGPEASKVHVNTYHAFGKVVLAEYKNYAADAPERQFENAIDEVLQYKIVKQIQDDLPARDILRGDQVRDIIDTIANAKSAQLTPDDLATIAATNIAASKEINLAVAPIFTHLKPRMKFDDAVQKVYEPLQAVFAQFSGDNLVGKIEPEANFLLRGLSDAIAAESAKAKPSVKPLSDWRKNNFERDDAGNYRLKNRIANLKLESLARVMQSYNDYLAAHDLYDFADMIMEAIHYLSSDRGFRLTLSERFQFILLDEFQDTNTTQFEIIKLLTDYEQPQVMAVGDDDQAIFEFQGANASNLLEFQNYYQAKTIVLSENYRSSDEILQASHQVATQIEESFAKKHKVNKTLQAQAPWAASVGKISRHEFVSADAENYWIAKQVRQLLDQGTDPSEIAIITPRHKTLTPLLPYLKAQNIAITYEKREDILQDPRLHELAVLARFCHELANGRSPAHRLLEILSFRFWQIPPLAAIRAVGAHHREPALEILAKSDDPRLVRVAELLAALTTHAFATPLELWLDWAIGAAPLPSDNASNASDSDASASANSSASSKTKELRSPFLEYYTHHNATDPTYDTFSLYENLNSLRAALTRHLQTNQPRLADLIEFLDDYALAGAGVLNTSPYRDTDRAVQVMTAFKAKGLEFQHVFLVAVDSNSWGRGKGNNNLLVLPKNLIQIRHTTNTDDERRRVFFVALTRAKESLTLTNSLANFDGKRSHRLEYLEETEQINDDGEKVIVSPLLNQTVVQHTNDLAAARQATDLQIAWSATYHPETPELSALLRERMQNYRLSATDLTTFIDIIYAGPVEFYLNKVLRRPSPPPTPQIILGNLIHTVFERVTNQHIDDAAALDLFQRELAAQPLLEADRHYVAQRGEHALTTSLAAFRQILRDEQAVGEVNLSSAQIALTFTEAEWQSLLPHAPHRGDSQRLHRVPLTGKIDHLTVDPEARTIEVYDFKTGKFQASDWDKHPSLYKYKLQLGFYKLLLDRAPAYAGYRVTRGHILFVDPDRDDQVHDKVYEFTADDEQFLVRLIASVYHHATTLDFLQDPELMLEPDRGRVMRDVLDFAKKLAGVEDA